ncbi:MAG: cytochrome-c peroxidase [Bacteroidales bacterium]|nr:cytochrome-c peroxidase [Bacteroidales bacterium]MBQ9723036.1 cytochrome-c peroxidase [Bacteroidales bacterium]
MKKLVRLCAVVLLVAAAAAVVVYRAVNRVPSSELPLNEQVYAIFEDGGCLSCHSADPKLPFYAKLPVAGKIVMKDVDSGYRAFDMTAMMNAIKIDEDMNPVDLAKVEKVVLDDRMPMPKYYLMHWGSSLTKAKREIVLDWVAKERMAIYDDGLEGERAAEPVRPIDSSLETDPAKVALGFALFHDTRLSVDNTVSCASCHALETAGVDNKQYSEGVGGQLGGVNAPTVYNAVYNFVQFWDGRAKTLADQAAGPPLNPIEMASASFDEIIAKLEKDRKFASEFRKVYPDGLTEANITDAIEEFERTLITPDSRFDKWLRGDDSALTADELEGYELFKKYDCATCHAGPNLGGLSYEIMGLRRHYFEERGMELTVEDNGRFKETGIERDRHRFKVPGLRNIEHTWPYYHDGTRLTLEDAVRDMGLYQSGVELTQNEVDRITSFLNTLTGEFQGKPLTNANSR